MSPPEAAQVSLWDQPLEVQGQLSFAASYKILYGTPDGSRLEGNRFFDEIAQSGGAGSMEKKGKALCDFLSSDREVKGSFSSGSSWAKSDRELWRVSS
jgi:hypothetical protein